MDLACDQNHAKTNLGGILQYLYNIVGDALRVGRAQRISSLSYSAHLCTLHLHGEAQSIHRDSSPHQEDVPTKPSPNHPKPFTAVFRASPLGTPERLSSGVLLTSGERAPTKLDAS